MGKQVRVFDLLTKKQSLSVFKSQKKRNKLAEELRNATAYQKQLEDILESMASDKKKKTVAEIKSESWYRLKIRDELTSIQNKIDFLSVEIKDQRIQVAKETEKRKKFDEKKTHFQKVELLESERREEIATPSRIDNRSK